MSNPEKNLPPELASLEAKLANLKPSAGRLDRDRLMYELGQAQATPKSAPAISWKWTLGLTLTSNIVVALVMFLILSPPHATGLTEASQEPTKKPEITQASDTNEPSKTIDPVETPSEPSKPEIPIDSHDQWGRTLARWFGLPTYEPEKIPSARNSYFNIEDELLVQTPYTRLLANRTTQPRTPILVKEEKPETPRPPLSREELMKQYLDGEWN